MSWVQVVTHPEAYATLAINRKPVNSLNLELWEQLKQAFDDLEQNPAVRGVIFMSGLDRPVFTAGLPFEHTQDTSGILQ